MATLKAQMNLLTTGDVQVARYGAGQQKGFQQLINDTGQYRVHSIKAKSAVEQYTTALQKQDVVFKNWRKNAKLRNDVLKEQYRLQNMAVMGWKEDGLGRMSADMIIPRDVPERLSSFRKGLADVRAGQVGLGTVLNEQRMRIGLWSQSVKSASHNLINWGKNTQWAGRQMMVGLSLPFAALAAGTGALAYQIDKEMTRILKVYDYATDNIEAEGERIKEASFGTARAMANIYGQAAADTINILGELAATGKTGVELQKSAEVVSRASFLGELDRQDAIKTTITLQTVYRQNTEELAESFAYLNALENATSLSMRDMTVAIPKLAGVVKSLGGDVTDIGTLMTAAKAGGLEAAEGANALKTVLFRSVVPYGKGRDTFLSATNIDLQQLVKSTNGEAIPTLIKMGEAMEGLGQIERTAVLKDVFGIYQGSKAGIMIEQMLNIADASTQVGRAAIVAKEGMEAWGATQDREIAQMQNSASGQFKIALESIKVELAAVGEPFLEVATTIIKFVTDIIKSFNGLDEGTKKFWLMFLAVGAIIGPAVMITGVLATLVGTIIRMGATLLMATSRFRAVNADQHAAGLLAKQSTLAFQSEATAAQLLSHQLGKLNLNMQAVALSNHQMANSGISAASLFQTQSGRSRVRDVNTGKTRAATMAEQQRGREIAHQEALIENTERSGQAAQRASRNYAGIAAGIGSAVLMASLLTGTTNQWIIGLSSVLMMLPLILSGLRAIAATQAFISLASGVRGVATAIGSRVGLAGRLGGISRILPMLGAAAGPLGIALLAAGAGAGFLYSKLKKAKEEVRGLVSAGDDLAEVMGGTKLEPGEFVNARGDKVETMIARVNAFEKANDNAVKSLKKLGAANNDAALEQEVIRIGLDVFSATKDAKKARDAVQVALNAAGRPDMEIGLSFDNERWVNDMRGKISDALVDLAHENEGVWYDPGMANEVEERLKGEAERLAKMFGEVQAGIIKPEAFEKELDRVGDVFAAKGTEIVNRYAANFSEEELNIFKKYNIKTDAESMARALITNTKLANEFTGGMGKSGANVRAAANEMKNITRAYGFTSEQLVELINLENVDGISKRNLTTITSALAGTNILAANTLESIGEEAEGATPGVEGLGAALETADERAKKFIDAQKSMMSEAWGYVLEGAADQIEARHDANIESLEAGAERTMAGVEADIKRQEDDLKRRSDAQKKRHKAEDEAFKNNFKDREKAIEDAYDGRIAAIQAVMDKEEAAEKARQAAFEAEKTRIQRLADMYNQNIDFNVALNTGDMDEAAKLANNMRATQEQWGLDDAAAGAGTAYEERRAALQANIDTIEAERDARLEALEVEEETAKRLLEERQEREQNALEAEKERNREAADSRKEAEKKKADAAVKSANDSYNASKKALDRELATLRAFVPQNEAELRQHIGRIEAAYGRHGHNLDTKSVEWSNYVTRAMHDATRKAQVEMSTNVAWDDLGRRVGDQLSNNILGMSFPEFINWMQTGDLPAALRPPANPRQADRQSGYTDAGATPTPTFRRNDQAFHSGGPIKHNKGSGRAGRPLSAGLFSDEVPIIAQTGEFMMQRKAVDAIGIENLKAMNNGNMGPDRTGRMHRGGMVTGIGGMIQSLFQRGMAKSMIIGAARKAGDIMNGVAAGQVPSGIMSLMQNGATVGGTGGYGNMPVQFSAPGMPGLEGLPPGTMAAAPPGQDGFAGWLTATQRMVRPDVMAKVWRGLGMVPGQQLITSGLRPGAIVAGTNRPSLHGSGRAVDIGALARKDGGSAASEAMGDQIANVFRTQIPGVSEVLWKTMKGGNHYDHVHVGFRHGGGEISSSMTKGLKGGGYTLNDGYAKLHKSEAVLTAPLTQQLKEGIGNLDSSGSITYDIKMDFTGAIIREEVDIERAVEKVLNKKENRMGRKRTIK